MCVVRIRQSIVRSRALVPENKGIESRTTGLMSAASFVSEIGRYSSGRNLPLNCTHWVSQSVKFPSVSTRRSLFLDDLSIVSWRPAGIQDAVDETLSQSNSVYWLKITFKALTLLSEEKTNEQKISLPKMRKCVRDYAREKCIKIYQRIWKSDPDHKSLKEKIWTGAREGQTDDVLDSRGSRTQSRSKSVLRTSVFRRFCLVREKQAADEDGAQRHLRPQSCGQQRGRSQLATKEGSTLSLLALGATPTAFSLFQLAPPLPNYPRWRQWGWISSAWQEAD